MSVVRSGVAYPARTGAVYSGTHNFSGATVTLPNVEQFVIPPAALLATSAESAWYSANRTTIMRFMLAQPGQFAAVRMPCGTASGNIEVCVYSVVRTAASTWTCTKAGTSGVIACPTPSSSSIFVPFTADLSLTPGQYGLALWCDNTTATFSHTTQNPTQRAGWSLADIGTSGSGAPASLANVSNGSRSFAATLENRVPA